MPGERRYKWYVVAMLWCISFFNYADRQAIFSVFPVLEKQMGLTLVQLGLLGSSFAWVYGLCAPLAGNIVDRVSRKSAILAGLHVWSVICMATAFSRNFAHLLFFRMAEGLGETFYYPASMSMMSDYHGRATRSRAMGIHQTSVYFGTVAGGFFAGLIGQHYGWRWSFVVFGGLGVLLGLVLKRLLIEPARGAADLADLGGRRGVLPHARRIPLGEFLRIIWRTPTVLMLMLAFTCVGFVALVLLSWMPKFLYDRFHLGLAMSGLLATVFAQFGSMVGAPVGGWLADVLRRRYEGGRIMVQAAGVLCGAPFVVLCGASGSLPLVLLALGMWGICKGLYDQSTFASVFDVVRPEARGTAVGFMNLVGWLGGGGTAPLVVGLVAQRAGLGVAIAFAGSVYLLAGAFLLTAIFVFVKRDAERLRVELATEAAGQVPTCGRDPAYRTNQRMA